ncbi:cysteine synthase A [Oligella ureolytica]
MKFDNVLQTIGNTPTIRFSRLFGATSQVWIKSERSNPGGSIKDRIALAMVEDAREPANSNPEAPLLNLPVAIPVLVSP